MPDYVFAVIYKLIHLVDNTLFLFQVLPLQYPLHILGMQAFLLILTVPLSITLYK